MSGTNFSIPARVQSFCHAFSGLWLMLKTQHNARIHLAATLAVCTGGVILRISADDWRWLVVAIVLVWIAETLNTAFEHLCDVVSPQFHASVKASKDIAAGAVLISALSAAVIGAMVLGPYVVK
jgi:diacylglycerol kinase (ATP)